MHACAASVISERKRIHLEGLSFIYSVCVCDPMEIHVCEVIYISLCVCILDRIITFPLKTHDIFLLAALKN